MELCRRLALAVSLMLAVLAWGWSDATPFLALELPGPKIRQPEVVRNVAGPAWEALYATVVAVQGPGAVDPALARRIPGYQRSWSRGKSLAYRFDEPPVADLADLAGRQPGWLRLVVGDPSRGLILDATVRRIGPDDFHLGTSLSEYAGPRDMLFPWRRWAWLPLPVGLALFVLLPRPRRAPDAIRYPWWRVMLGDILWVLLGGLFFSLPFLIVGGTQPALTRWPLLVAFCWLLAAGGGILLVVAAGVAVFAVEVTGQGLAVTTLGGRRLVPFEAMEAFSPALYRTPRWFARLFWIVAVLAGRGVGQAMLLSHSENGGLAVRLRHGGRLLLWITDALGGTALAGAERIDAALRRAGVAFDPRTSILEGFWPGTFVGPVKGGADR
jgi:hypothetical protein